MLLSTTESRFRRLALGALALALSACTTPQSAQPPPTPVAPTPAPAPAPSPTLPPSAAPAPMPGSDRDEHGCLGSGGYQWCAKDKRCVRMWELAKEKGVDSAEDYCRQP